MKKLLILFAALFVFTTAHAKQILVCEVNGIISGYTHNYLKQALKKATDEDAVLLVRLDTPGGLLDSTRKIVQMFLETETPVIVFVAPQGARAGSAGTFITLSAGYAAMAEGSNIGAAHPVDISGKDIQGDMAQKIENDTVAFIKSIAEKRGRNADAAVETVTQSVSYTAKEALEKGLIDAIANTNAEVAKLAAAKLGFQAGDITTLNPTPMQKTAFFLSDPNILILLLFIGIAAIFLEFKMPGTFIFAGVGIAALVLFLAGINIIPVNSLALLLILAGLGLLIAEIFVPSFGLLTLGAVVSMGFGMYLMFSREGNMGIGVSFWLIFGVIGTIAAIFIILGRLLLKDFHKKTVTGREGMTGETGIITDWDNGAGHIFIHGELWKAKSTFNFNKNDSAKVVAVQGMVLILEANNNE
ncbi:nodulation protein NfeD [Seleniivibrio woodruffii]|uniref:NfeD family protein n=1 Tax=Seleniivibrio woodruffii TaxID=1078050 RepID=UPI0026F06EC9|nr:nodulation protein NfeD [Seleniivibrio woodruffii]